MDFGKIIKVGMIPIVALVILDTIASLLSLVPSLLVVGAVIGLIGWIILLWAGYMAAKAKMSTVDAGITGAIVAIVAGIINLVVTAALASTGIGANAAVLALGIVIFLVAGVIGIAIATVIGFVLGAIGGLIGQKF